MKRKMIARPRNNLVALARFRKAGSHRKSNKALRAGALASVRTIVIQDSW